MIVTFFLHILQNIHPITFRLEISLAKKASLKPLPNTREQSIKEFIIRICPMKGYNFYPQELIIRKMKRRFSMTVEEATQALHLLTSTGFLIDNQNDSIQINIVFNQTRKKIMSIVKDYPGLHINLLVKELQIPKSTLLWHLVILEKNNLIKIEKVGKFKIISLPSIELEKCVLGFLILKPEIRFFLHKLTEKPTGMTKNEIEILINSPKSTIAYMLKKLENYNLVTKLATSPIKFQISELLCNTIVHLIGKQKECLTTLA